MTIIRLIWITVYIVSYQSSILKAEDYCAVCPYGQGVTQPCDPERFLYRVCSNCIKGYFVEGQTYGPCLKCQKCPRGEIQVQKCTAFHDVACQDQDSNKKVTKLPTTMGKKTFPPWHYITPSGPKSNRPVDPNKLYTLPNALPGHTSVTTDPQKNGSFPNNLLVFYIVLAVIITLAFVGVICLGLYCYRKRRKSKKSEAATDAPGAQDPFIGDIPPPEYNECSNMRPPSYGEAVLFSNTSEQGSVSINTSRAQQTHHVYPELPCEKLPISDRDFHNACSEQTSGCHAMATPSAPPGNHHLHHDRP